MSTRQFAPARWLWVFALLLSSASLALAQTTVSGTITDGDNGETLIGANVVVPGTSIGTATDFDGNFELTVPEGTTQLAVSYAGYQTQTVDLTPGQTTYNLTLSAGELLDEVVVVGYGTQTQGEVTSAVTSVSEKDFNQGVVNNPTQLVQGKVAGLRISTPSGDPNAQGSIRLRGLSTFGANTDPLVIIDGVIGASLNTVDPSDIAAIDVLKDGSAAAIYGTRASSGVILITTKRGREGEARVTYRVQGGIETLANTIPVADAARYRELRPDDVITNDLNNDYFDELTRVAASQVHNLSMSGGLGTGDYRASVNFRDAEGVAVYSGFDQLNGRLTVNQTALNEMFNFNLTASATTRNEDLGFNEAFQYATIYNPTVPFRTEEGGDGFESLGGFSRINQFDFFNPIGINEQNSRTRRVRDQLISGRVGFRPIDGLEIAAQYSTNTTNRRLDLFANRFSEFPITGANVSGFGASGLGILFQEELRNQLFETTATYEVEVGDGFGLDFLAGYSYQDLEVDNSTIQTQGFVSDNLALQSLGLASGTAAGLAQLGSGGDRSEIESYFGRVQLDYAGIYFLAASLRSDGSTRFGVDEKRGLFPAVSAGVDLGEFIPADAVDRLKLRAGYGVTGNIPQLSLQSLARLGPSGDAAGFPLNGQVLPVVPSAAANTALRFERKGEFNVGLDFALLDYRLRGTFDFFNRSTEGLLFPVNFPIGSTVNGALINFPEVQANVDDVNLRNRGVEFTLGYDVVQTDGFTYSPQLVFSAVRTTLVESGSDDIVFPFFPGGTEGASRFDPSTSPGAPGQNNAPTQVIRVGEQIGQLYTYVARGIDAGGNFIFEDLNGDGMITEDAGLSPDKQVVGQGLPDFSLNLQNEFTFGNFDANLFFRGDFGHSLANMPRNFYENVAGTQYNVVETEFFNEDLRQARFNSYYVERADFVVLDNASIGYNFDINDDRVSSIRVGLAGRNLFYITNYTGVSPEVRDADFGGNRNFVNPGRGNILAPGIDRRNNYFRTRSFNISASVTF